MRVLYESEEGRMAQADKGHFGGWNSTLPAWLQHPGGRGSSDRRISITVDDLPAASADIMTSKQIGELNSKLVSTFRKATVPVVGFVNEIGLLPPRLLAGDFFRHIEMNERVASLRMWTDAGFELGNHTFSHQSLNRNPFKIWKYDVILGETVTRSLLRRYGMDLRYFRHPFLDVGADIQTRLQAEAFLEQRGYRIAPVTIDTSDWLFAAVYDEAGNAGDSAFQDAIVTAYLAHTLLVIEHCEQISRKLFGYEINHILLVHANSFVADCTGALINLLRRLGYGFITLQEALEDPVYGISSNYVGEKGATWLNQLAITLGQDHLIEHAPTVPLWIQSGSRALQRGQTGS